MLKKFVKLKVTELFIKGGKAFLEIVLEKIALSNE